MLDIAYLPRRYEGTEPAEEKNTIHGYYLKNREVFSEHGINLNLKGSAEDNDLAWIGNAVWDEWKESYKDLPIIQELVITNHGCARKPELAYKPITSSG